MEVDGNRMAISSDKDGPPEEVEAGVFVVHSIHHYELRGRDI